MVFEYFVKIMLCMKKVPNTGDTESFYRCEYNHHCHEKEKKRETNFPRSPVTCHLSAVTCQLALLAYFQFDHFPKSEIYSKSRFRMRMSIIESKKNVLSVWINQFFL